MYITVEVLDVTSDGGFLYNIKVIHFITQITVHGFTIVGGEEYRIYSILKDTTEGRKTNFL